MRAEFLNWLLFDMQFGRGHDIWLIAWTFNNLARGQLVGFVACQTSWSTVLQFEQLHSLSSHMSAIKRSVINCSELVFNIGRVVFYMLRLELYSWLRLCCVIKLNFAAEQTDRVVCVFPDSCCSKLFFFFLFNFGSCLSLFLSTLFCCFNNLYWNKSVAKTDQDFCAYVQCERCIVAGQLICTVWA